MKKFLLHGVMATAGRALIAGLFFFLLMPGAGHAQVTFTQTTNADFNEGVLNSAVVGSDNVYLQYAANEVGTWLTTTVLPQTLTGHRVVSWNDRFAYVVGGYNNTSYVSTVYRGTISSTGVATWNVMNPLPVPLRDPAVVIGTNTIYVMGGRDASQVYNTIYYASIAADGTLGTWQTSAITLPAARWGHTATYLMGHIYVIGGSGSLTETTAVNNVYYTKVLANNDLSAFTNGTVLTAARNRHATVTYNNKLYVIGGYDNAGTRSTSVYIATPALTGSTGSWTAGTVLPTALSNHTAVASNGIIVVLGGVNSGGVTNNIYYAPNPDALTWSTSTNPLYDNLKDAGACTGNGQIYHIGGANSSGTPVINCRYSNLSLTTNYATHGVYVSNPYFELGAERVINSLTFNKTTTGAATVQISYRLAGNNGVWSDWTALTSTSPIVVSQTKRYLQYAVILTGSTTNNAILHDMTLTTPGTELAGNLNAILTFTKALSPYWATADIWFDAGTHTFEAGATILFMPGTGMSVGAAHIECNGTAVDSVKFLYYTDEVGQWDGIYFNENSDVGVNSAWSYTVVAGAGFGSNNANLYCYYTSEPSLNRCNIRRADGHGIRLNYSHINVQNSTIKSNMEAGFFIENSNPVINTSTITNNAESGIELTNQNSLPNFSGTTISNNVNAIYFSSSNVTLSPLLGTLTLTGNTYNGICLPGGYVTDNQRWNSLPTAFPIIILDDLYVGKYYEAIRLTIEPGNTIKFLPGKKLQISHGNGGHHGGGLYAIGVPDSLITFTPFNGVAGGWEGIYFEDRSDWWSNTSVMDYCVVEKGNSYNVYVENTTQPSMTNCIIRNAVQDGMRFYGGYNSVSSTSFLNNGRYPVYYAEPHTTPILTSNTYTGNTINMLGFCGGNITESRTFRAIGIPYHIMDNIKVGRYGEVRRLTINPGVTLNFASGKGMQVSYYQDYHCAGELYAEGKADSLILFQPYSGTAGDWAGIYFEDRSDYWGATSKLKYCTVTKANNYNVLVENTGSVTISNCTFSYATLDGLRYNNSYGSFNSCAFNNNGRYPVYFMDWASAPHHRTNTFSANNPNLMALAGGNYSENRTILKDGTDYIVLDSILVAKYGDKCRLTIEPGVTMSFPLNKGIQVGWFQDYYRGGELYAVGKSDSIITFKPTNNTNGGWKGIYFEDRSDWNGSTNQLKYCLIKQGNNYNILLESTNSVTIENCTVSNAVQDGIRYNWSNGTFINNTISSNGRYPVYFMNWYASPVHNSNTFTSNVINYIAMSGGHFTESKTVYKDNADYYVLDSILIARYADRCRLTIEPGVTMKFATGKFIQVGRFQDYYWGGELYAEGTNAAWITMTPYTEINGDWKGIFFADQSDWGGSTSSLKYCNIRRGEDYNIRVDYSNQPVIDNCRFQLSTGHGLQLLSGNLTISNTTFNNNALHGIYIDGTGTGTIGNSTTTTCSMVNNGGYQLYNNSTSDVNARYNYWGTGDSTMVQGAIFDKADNSAKGRVFTGVFAQIPSLYTTNTTLSGSLKYANVGANPIKNAAMVIKNFAGTTIGSTTSNASGVYAFAAVPSGRYQMTITPAAVWGGCNSTDALAILNHFAMISPLTNIKLAAADVNWSHSINGTDALLVMKRYSGMITSFPAGDYLYHSDTVIINNSTGVVTNNFDMICFGDVNASYAPAKKSTGSVGIVYEGNLALGSDVTFDFPVKVKNPMEVGAISLGFYYPEEYLEILDVQLSNGVTGFSWSAVDGLFRMGWCDQNALNVNADEVVVILKMKTKDVSGVSNGIYLQIYEDCEFADASATPDPMAVVSVPTINAPMTGVQPQPENIVSGLSVYPNPLKENSAVVFTLASDENLQITLIDMLGKQIASVADGAFNAGKHRIDLPVSELTPGIYFLRITRDGSNSLSDMIKLVVSR